MSLAINIDKIKRVLLVDGWHSCSHFYLDSYEYVQPEKGKKPWPCLAGGQEPLVAATGFSFQDMDGRAVCGPITSILAVSE